MSMGFLVGRPLQLQLGKWSILNRWLLLTLVPTRVLMLLCKLLQLKLVLFNLLVRKMLRLKQELRLNIVAQEDAQEAAQDTIVAEGTTLQPASDISAQTALGALATVLHVEGVSPRASGMVADAQALATQAVAIQPTVVDQGTSAKGTVMQPVSHLHSTEVLNVDVDVALAKVWNVDGVSL